MKTRWITTVTASAALVAGAGAFGVVGASTAGAATGATGGQERPLYAVLHTARSGARGPAASVPTWTFSYTYKTVAYHEIFVGTKPASGTSTTIPVYVIPIRLTSGTFTTDPTAPIGGGHSAVQRTEASPIFQSGVDFVQGGTDVGTTQYIDAFQRAALWGKVSAHPTYHVLLGQPTVEPVQALTVPAADGTTSTALGFKMIVANVNWFDGHAQSMLASLAIPANSLPIFVTTQAYLSGNSGLSGCCIGGYHNYDGTQAYAQFTYIQQTGQFSQDVSALSHEVGEYVDDPLTNNTDVPASCGANGGQRIYEVGDPLEGDANFGDYPYTLGGVTYHLQDLVLPPYFGAPGATSVNHWKTFQGTALSVCQNGG
jgi:hypothetical protein